MLKTVYKYLDAYLATNEEVLEPEQYAEVKASKAFISALMETGLSFYADGLEKENEKLKARVKHLRSLLFTAMKEKQSGDTKVKRSEFIDIWNEAMEGLGSDECELYGNNVTVHWHGIYCDCSDGAVAHNHIIEGIKGVMSEEDEE